MTQFSVEEAERLADEYDHLKHVWHEGGGATHRDKELLPHAARELGLLESFKDLTTGDVTLPSRRTI